MKISPFPFQITDWSKLPSEEHKGETGTAWWKVQYFGDVRVRMVEYPAGYLADHWCPKGHFIYCVQGEMVTELKDGRSFALKQGMSYQTGDDCDDHRSWSEVGVKLFIVD
jgi:hypothetical protein